MDILDSGEDSGLHSTHTGKGDTSVIPLLLLSAIIPLRSLRHNLCLDVAMDVYAVNDVLHGNVQDYDGNLEKICRIGV